MGVNLIWAGIHAKVKSPFGEKLFLSWFTKIHKKKENNTFDFCIIQFSQSYCFYLYTYLQKCVEYKKKEKGLTKLIRSFGNVTDQTEGAREALGFLVILIKIFVHLSFCFELSVLD